MILAAKFSGLLYRHYIFTLFDNTDQRVVATRIATDPTEILFGDIAALNAEFDALFNGAEHISKSCYINPLGLNDVEGDALRGFWSDAWQPAKLVD